MSEAAVLAELVQKMQADQQAMQLKFVEALERLGAASNATPPVASLPNFESFDVTAELYTDYWARFQTFMKAHSVPADRSANVFLTNQTVVVYKMLSNIAEQRTPPVAINDLSLQQIHEIMGDQYNPTRYIVRERYKFWSLMNRKPGETVQELASRIRQDAVTCDFSKITDPQDEALRTRFICSVNNCPLTNCLIKKYTTKAGIEYFITSNNTDNASTIYLRSIIN